MRIENCCKCGTEFGMSDAIYRAAQERREGFLFYCPNGHPQHYVTGKSKEQQLAEQLEAERLARQRAEQRIAEAHDVADRERRVAAAYKGVATRMNNRVKAGVCPCCNRHFENLHRHMASQHPDFDNVIDLAAARA